MYYDLSTVTFDIERQIRELEQKLIAANQVHDREKYMECRRKIRELEAKLEEMRNRQERLK
jgi:hypothetical protein